MTKKLASISGVLASILTLFLLLAACDPSAQLGKSRIRFEFGSSRAVSEGDLFQNLGIESLRLTVSVQGTVVFETSFSQTSITLELDEGPNRLFVLEGIDAQGAILYRGQALADLVANKIIQLDITLEVYTAGTTTSTITTSTTLLSQITGKLNDWVVKAGARNNGGLLVAAGKLNSVLAFVPQGPEDLYFGTFEIYADGNWTYTLDETNPSIYGLGAGSTLVDSILVTSGLETETVSITIYGASDTAFANGQYIQGDGSGGGGGGAFNAYDGGAGGNGGASNTIIEASTGNDVIFGDGSGGGAGGRGVGGSNAIVSKATGGGGADSIVGGDGNDIIFGDGFHGLVGDSSGGKGGFGGGGGGGSGAYLGGALGGSGGLGGGSGSGYAGSEAALITSFGTLGGIGNTSGGNSVITLSSVTGLGGLSYGIANQGYGGGGGFGGSNGGAGRSDSSGPGNPGVAGTIGEHRYDDSTGIIHSYVLAQLVTLLTSYPEYGAGDDLIDGGPGSDHLFGLGGNDVFVFELYDATSGNDIDTIYDFSSGDKLSLKIDGTSIDAGLRDALIDAQTSSANDRTIVFRSDYGKQVTIVLRNLGRDIVASDFL